MKLRKFPSKILVRQQAIPRANFDTDLCRHMVSLGHNELIKSHMTTDDKWLLSQIFF